MTSEMLFRDIRDEVPVSVEVLEAPIKSGNEENYSELLISGESVNPAISLDVASVEVGSIEYSVQEVDSEGRFAGRGRQVNAYFMTRLVHSEHISDSAEDPEGQLVEARSTAFRKLLIGVELMNESQSVSKAAERISNNEGTAKSNVWFGLAK